MGWQAGINQFFGEWIVAPLFRVLFWDVWFWDDGTPDETQLPLIVGWLVLGAIFFTLRMQFINVRGFRHAIVVTAGKYDRPGDPGEVTHFQALSSALSATVGLGNIAGVAVAVGTGGPGAVFWMIVAGLLGMTTKFTECTLGQLYRVVAPDGKVSGGPMRYLRTGLAEKGHPVLGKVLAVTFAVMCIGGSFGGGNMFQANQSFAQVAKVLPLFSDWGYGLAMVALVGVVIIGGIRRIGRVAEILVPMMCLVYVIAGIVVIAVNVEHLDDAFRKIVVEAFTPQAGLGGMIGVLVTGFRRACFSNEAGLGSASIAHAAAATDEPVREGIVALLEPFIDTVIVCTMTGVVVVIAGTYTGEHGDGVAMTSAAFETVLPWFDVVLAFAVFCFAYSTMISWSYYGERCWSLLFGERSSIVYKLLFLVCTFLGPILELGAVLDFSDGMILGMALPNLIGLYLLSDTVKAKLDDYWRRLEAGKMKPVR